MLFVLQNPMRNDLSMSYKNVLKTLAQNYAAVYRNHVLKCHLSQKFSNLGNESSNKIFLKIMILISLKCLKTTKYI